MKRFELAMLGCLTIATIAAAGQTSDTSQPQSSGQKATQKTQGDTNHRGQEVFNQNCSRCHQEPKGFSSNISGTVARHMRVRANLSDDDYKALVKFLNP